MTEKEIEKQLRNMPNIQDTRSKEVIMAKLMADDRLQNEEQISRNTSRHFKWMPIAITLAAILFVSLLIPSMFLLKGNEEKAEQIMDNATDYEQSSEAELEDAMAISDERNILFSEDITNQQLLKIGLVTNAITIPVTFLIPTERIEKDFPDDAPNTMQLYQMYASKIPEEQLGFDVYHPYKGELIAVNDQVLHKLPKNHGYDEASAALSTYMNSIRLTFPDYATYQPVDLAGEPIEFNQVGQMEAIDLSKEKTSVAYYRYELTSGNAVLVSNIGNVTYDTVEQALYGMKELNGDLFSSLVPENVSYDVRQQDETIYITFTEPLNLSTMEHEDARLMIEGFILTATNQHAHVQFENIVQDIWEGYDFSKSYTKPVAVNPIIWTYD